MKKFTTWLETVAIPPSGSDPWEDWELWYSAMEPHIRHASMDELERTGTLSIAKMSARAGVGEGYAAFLVREFLKRHGGVRQDVARGSEESGDDGYLYHITTKRRLPMIRKMGLSPAAPPQFSNYADYSRGKVFFCEKRGIAFWSQRVEEHEEANSDRPSRVVVLKVRRSLLEDKIQNDARGTEDSRSPSYYVTERVPARLLEVV